MMTLPQLEMFTGTGAMKSFICDVKLSDERPHSRAVIVATAPPWSMEYSSSRSPTVRTLLGLPAQFVDDLFSSKSISVVPDGSLTRRQNRLRNPGPPTSDSTYAPKVRRSLLLFGMLPNVDAGQMLSSL